MKKALILGITGQDGSYLAELLLQKDYEVTGFSKDVKYNLRNIEGIRTKINLIEGDITEEKDIQNALNFSNPDEIYNLAGQTSMEKSYSNPELTMKLNGESVRMMLEEIRKYNKNIRFFQALSNKLYEGTNESPQNELTPFKPLSPYALGKIKAYEACIEYKDKYGMFIANGILYNHESSRRTNDFITKQIVEQVAKIKLGKEYEKLTIKTPEAKRDWGYAKEFVEAMWLMLQQEIPDDYVIGTGEVHTLKEFCEEAFKTVGIDEWKKYIELEDNPPEKITFVADNTKIKTKLRWKPQVTFKKLVKTLVEEELEIQKNNLN